MDFFKNLFDTEYYINSSINLKKSSLSKGNFNQIWNHCNHFGWKDNFTAFKDTQINELPASFSETNV